MKRKILGVLLIIAGVATAAEPADETADQKQELIDIMKTVNFVPQMGKDNPLCKSFYEDFRQQRHIEHIRPIVKADTYDDPALRPYREKCPKLEMHKTMAFEPKDIELAGEPEDEAEAEARAVGIYYGMGNFQLYKVDINNHPEDGRELVLYYEGDFDRKYGKPYPANRVYRQVDLAKCEVATIVHFNIGDSAKWTRNGIIRYKGKNAIYTLESWGGSKNPSYYWLELWMYSDKLKRMSSICAYQNSQ